MSCAISGASSIRVDLTAGLYYFTQSYSYLERRVLPTRDIRFHLGADVDVANYAVFAQADYHVDPGTHSDRGRPFHARGEGREDRHLRCLDRAVTLQFRDRNLRLQFSRPRFSRHHRERGTWDNFTPKLGFQWQADDDASRLWTLGARRAQRRLQRSQHQPQRFRPGPTIRSCKMPSSSGVKSDWFDNRLHANGTVFYDTIKRHAARRQSLPIQSLPSSR